MSTGWRCPGCGACYAPWVSVCRTCGESEPSKTWTPPPPRPRPLPPQQVPYEAPRPQVAH